MPKDKKNEATTEIDHVDRGISSITQIPNLCKLNSVKILYNVFEMMNKW